MPRVPLGDTAQASRAENLYRPLVPPPIKVLCYAALADLFKYLPESKAHPEDVVVRQKLQIASWMSLWPVKFEKYRWAMRSMVCVQIG